MNDRLVHADTAIGRPFIAALCAGSIFIIATAFSVGNVKVGEAIGLLPFLLPLGTIFGFVLAVVPCLLGTVILHALGRGNVGVRLPAFWALIGGLMGGGALAATSADTSAVIVFSATGTLCALICRSGARWT